METAIETLRDVSSRGQRCVGLIAYGLVLVLMQC